MSRISLSDTGDWQLVHGSQDIRGYAVVDAAGQTVGTVASMIVDTDAELVSTLVLEDGTEVAAADVTIGENVIYLGSGAVAGTAAGMDTADVREGVTVFDGGRVVRREDAADMADFDVHADDFRRHHAETYGTQGRSFDSDSEAYRYGYTSAHAEPHRNRAYPDAETDLRTAYPSDFDADREAVRYGYDRAQRRRS